PAQAPSSSFVGSRKTGITAVSTARYCQFFVSRINPLITAAELARDILSNVAEVKSVKCCKIKTRHSSYASFHVVVPEERGQLLAGGDAWPEVAFVKKFNGRLLASYILETFDSQSNADANANSGTTKPVVKPVPVMAAKPTKSVAAHRGTKGVSAPAVSPAAADGKAKAASTKAAN
ncbi:Hypothetical predicted protein, partial [Olea europaea subsp. europaea]